ncbi:MAG: hypothetical protein RL701_2738, partial [Pseudomonadota bacterium]
MNSALERIDAHLRSEQVPFAVIGATAMAVHGVSRATQDVDLLATSRRCLRPEFWAPLHAAGLLVELREGDDDDPLAGVIRIVGPAEDAMVDVIVGRTPWQTQLLTQVERYEIDGVLIPVVRLEDLVLLKLYAGGVQDRWDITQLLAANPQVIELVTARVNVLP